MEWQHEAIERIDQYSASRRIVLTDRLGQGYDGVVFSTSRGTAVNALAFEKLYVRERDVYLRLRCHAIEDIHGFAVPSLIVMIACGSLKWKSSRHLSCSTSPERIWISARIVRMMFSKNGWKTNDNSSVTNAGMLFSPSWQPSVGSGYTWLT